MSVATTNNRVEATGNGATTAFPVSFVFNDDTDLKVYQAGTLKTLATHYTVSGGDGATGTVTFLAAPANGEAIIILRDPPKTQATSFRNQGRFFAEVHEAAFDKLTMIVQRLSDLLTRAAVLPDTVASTVDPTLPTPSAGGVLSWNSTADGLENGTTVGAINSAAGNAAAAAASATAAQTAQTAAELAETNAETAETNAEAAAVAAQAAADSIGFRDVVFLTSADSPYSVVQATSGKLLSIDTSGGAVTVTLPAIAGLTLPFTVGIKKTTGDANAVTINRSSTDTFDDGSTSKTLSGVAGTTLIPDTDPAPDKWSASDWGASTGQQKKQQFVGGVDFTAGVTTTLTITETPIPSSKDALEVFFDGAYQQESEWEYASSTGVITFDVAIPGGTSRVETIWTTPLAIGTPADGTITTAKLATTLISGATAETSPAIDDLLLLSDTSAGTLDKITLENLLKVISSLTEDTSPDLTADYLLTYDASASAVKKVLLGRGSGPVLLAATAASGTSTDFAGIPSWVRRITIVYAGISYNAGAQPMIQIGDSGGIETTSYASAGGDYVPTANHNSSTAGFIIAGGTALGAAANIMHGRVVLEHVGGNQWVMSGFLATTGTANTGTGGGTKTLSDVLTQVRCTTVAGTSTHDAGTFAILGE